MIGVLLILLFQFPSDTIVQDTTQVEQIEIKQTNQELIEKLDLILEHLNKK